jgi:hypothetical protein
MKQLIFPACLSLLILSAASSATYGQGAGGPRPGTTDATNAPIDGGASLLLAAGAAYGLRRIKSRK